MNGRQLIGGVLVALALASSGCGAHSSSSGRSKPNLVVSAASSLKAAFTRYGEQFGQASARFSFAGSDLLAAQIEQGVRPDVLASANLTVPEMLFSKGLVSKPVAFASNRLVLAVPAGSTKIKSVDDAARPGVTLAIGSASVPIGSYTRTLLSKLPAALGARILANVRSEEPDVQGIVGKLIQGAVDGGFTYVTDVRAAKGALTTIELPARLQPAVAYGVSIVRGSRHAALAQRFIDGLLGSSGKADLRAAGFLPAPAK
jgi:molybdate transport system substrate-binding protein